MRKNDLRFRVQGNDEEDGDEEYDDLTEMEQMQAQEEEMKGESKAAKRAKDKRSNEESDDEEFNEDDTNYYKENIFNREDYYLFRSVMYFYGGEYEKSVQDLEQCSNIMHSSKVLYPKNQFPDNKEGDD